MLDYYQISRFEIVRPKSCDWLCVMELRQLRYFICVADMGSFSRAADALSTAQSAVSRHVMLLEAELGQRLFSRHGRGVRLNESGKRLYAHARVILEQLSRAKQDILDTRDVPVGTMVLGLPYSVSRVFTVPFVRAFTEAFPQAKLAINEGSSDHILEWLTLGRLDIGLVFNPGNIRGVHTEELVQDRLCLIMTSRKPLALLKEKETITLREIAQYPMVIPRSPHTLRMLIDEQLSRVSLTLDVRLEVDSISTIVDLVRNREGVTILPRSVATAYSIKGDLSAYPVVQPQLPFSLHMAIHENHPVTALSRRSADMIRSLIPKLVRT